MTQDPEAPPNEGMQPLRLIDLDAELVRVPATGPEAFASRFGAGLGDGAGLIREVADQTLTLYQRVPRDQPWIGYLTVGAGEVVVGGCGFTSAPTVDGTVEIAYFTLPPMERRGYGTAMASALIEVARKSGLVRQVIAHTLPEPNASSRILQRVGISWAGEIQHPEDGRIWLWERILPPAIVRA